MSQSGGGPLSDGASQLRGLVRRIADVAAAVSVAYGLGVAVWTKSHPQLPEVSAVPQYVIVWFVNLPIFVAALIWLIVRLSRFLPAEIETFSTKHPFISRAVGGLVIAAVVGAAVEIARRL